MTNVSLSWPTKKYDIIYIDPPWMYYGDPNKNAAAGKHYNMMTLDQIKAMDIKGIINRPGVLFCWATAPRLHFAIEAINAWGLHYRGVAHVWVKTRKSDNGIIHGQGIRATYSKPTTEYLLFATTSKQGRPFKLLDEKLPQVVLAPRVSGQKSHSSKPAVFRKLIEQAYGQRSRIEIFARGKVPGWDVWGDQAEI